MSYRQMVNENLEYENLEYENLECGIYLNKFVKFRIFNDYR